LQRSWIIDVAIIRLGVVGDVQVNGGDGVNT
jgi:hypothetical protein